MVRSPRLVRPIHAHAVAPRRWSRFRLTLRLLMLLVLLLGGGLGWLAYRARLQHEAVQAVERAGGSVSYEWQVARVASADGQDWQPLRQARTRVPQWLVKRLGPDHFTNVATVYVGKPEREAVMARVGRLERAEWVAFVDGGDASPRALAPLRGMPRLHQLSAPKSGISDLTPIGRLTQLDFLNVAGNPVTDAGFAPVANLKQLRMIQLDGTGVGDSGLRSLRGLTRLSHVTLADSGVTDAGLAELAALPNLARLDLGGTQVTDAGLAHLARSKSLVSVRLTKTRVTPAGLNRLKKAKPRLRIIP